MCLIIFGGVFMDMSSQPEKWINLADVADYLGVSKDTIRNWIKNDALPAHKVGRLWKFKISEVDQWVMKNKKIH